MDSKVVKLALKNAREAIRTKDFKEALRHCKSILAYDRTNYNALVFVGVAAEGMEQFDQALKAYKKATAESPDQILAWQGLCGFYEKNKTPENDAHLVEVYEQLVNKFFINEKEKRLEIINKLSKLLVSLGDTEKAVDWCDKLLSEEEDETKRSENLLQLISLLLTRKSLTPQHEALLLKTYKEALSRSDFPEDEVKIQKYLDLVSKHYDRNELLEECSRLHRRFPSLLAPTEVWLLLLLDKHIVSDTDDDQIVQLSDKLKASENGRDTAVLHVAMGYLALQTKKLIQAKDHLLHGIKKDLYIICGYHFLSATLFTLHADSACVEYCQKGLKMLETKHNKLTVSSDTVRMSFLLTQAKCLLRIGTSGSLNEAEEILMKIKSLKEEDWFHLALVYIAKDEIQKAEECIASCSMSEGRKLFVQGWICFKSCQFEKALPSLEKAVLQEPTNSEAHFMLGRTLWELRANQDVERLTERCFTAFLKAAQLDPYNSQVFLYLGHFNAEIQNDKMKARKCYQKAFDLDNTNEVAGAALCDMLVAMGDEEAARSLLISATNTSSAGCGKWAWLRVGLDQVKHEDPSLAIRSFQSALRADPADHHVWECLAEGYLHRGSYTAALKAFTKAAELDPQSMYSLYQIANIKQTLGELPEAITEYKQIMTSSPNYVPALKGLGETYLLQTKQHLSQHLNDLACDDCQAAISYLTRAAGQRPDFCCLWKLLGDACTVLHPLASQTFSIEVPVKLTTTTSKDSNAVSSISKLELLQIGARCYGRALKGMPDSDSLWHDLGVNYFHQSEGVDFAAATSLADQSAQALKKSLSLNCNDYRHWNALGVVACSKYYYKPALAQHCFIKSIEAESNNVVAWTNLGALYLKEDNIKLAHEAFKIAQSLQPSYVACWIGQALIAETVDPVEAMDLFRHTTELGNHLEGAVGYGHWVCSMLNDAHLQNAELFLYCIQHMAAIPTASDALTRYTGRVKTDSAAYNMLGMLLEHQGLFTLSAQAYRRACDILEQQDTDGDKLIHARLNLARVLCEGHRYAECVGVFETVPTVETADCLCYLALALYKSGQLQESARVYDDALQRAESDADRSDIHAALGMVHYQTGDLQTAKTAFFSSFQLSPPSVIGLQALCSLGLVQSDWTLVTAVLQELAGVKSGVEHIHKIAWLKAVFHTLQGNVLSAKSHLQMTVHKHSQHAGVWKVLSEFLIRFYPDVGKTSASCARVCEHLDRSLDKFTLTLLSLAQLQGGCHHHGDANNNVLSSAQRALHMYPDSVPNLCIMVAATHAQAVIQMSSGKGTQLFQTQDHYINMILSTAGCSSEIKVWCLQLKVIGSILGEDLTETTSTLQQLAGSAGNTAVPWFIDVMTALIRDDVSAVLIEVEKRKTDFYLWQILTQMYVNRRMIVEADSVVRSCLQLARSHSKNQVQMMSLLKLASLPFQQMMSGEGEREDMRSLFDEAVTEVLKLNPESSAALLMLAVLALSDNVRLAKRHFLRSYAAATPHDSLALAGQIARGQLVRILHQTAKDSDLLQKLLSDASLCGDQKTVQMYKELKASATKSGKTDHFDE